MTVWQIIWGAFVLLLLASVLRLLFDRDLYRHRKLHVFCMASSYTLLIFLNQGEASNPITVLALMLGAAGLALYWRQWARQHG